MSQSGKHDLRFEDGGFIALVLVVSFAFAWLMAPFFGAILWGLVAAILFEPVNRRLVIRLNGRRNLSAVMTLLLIIGVAVLPALLIAFSLVQEALGVYEQVQAGRLDVVAIVENLQAALPGWVQRGPLMDLLPDIEELKAMIGPGIASGLQTLAGQAVGIGQDALSFLAALGVMLYLTFFLLRDGEEMAARIRDAVPLRPALRDVLIDQFALVVRATMKGTVVVAVLQGLVGGTIFWLLGIEGALLWGVMMGLFSLVPAVGTGIVWVPVAIYLFATGSTTEGMILTGCGLFIIGMIDNLLRPILVGQETRMPDFVVLIATLSGLQIFGLSGFIIGPVIAALFIAVWETVTHWRSLSAALEG
jgi:predicted PurR-regulated permease PerM